MGLHSTDTPTEQEAIALWMYAAECTLDEISRRMSLTKSAAQNVLQNAKKKAVKSGVRILYEKPKPVNEKMSGMAYLMELAREAKLTK